MPSSEKYAKILNRFLLTDIIMIVVLILVSLLVVFLLFKFLPNKKATKPHKDWSNKTARRVICISILIICIFAGVITGREIANITSDLKNEAWIWCAGSYSAARNEMVVRTEDGDTLKLSYLHSTVDDFESEHAEIVYSERSRILLSCEAKS